MSEEIRTVNATALKLCVACPTVRSTTLVSRISEIEEVLAYLKNLAEANHLLLDAGMQKLAVPDRRLIHPYRFIQLDSKQSRFARFGTMTVAATQPLTLEEILKFPKTKPASEHIEGLIIQKSMPKSRHSCLQGKLGAAINQVAKEAEIACAFPELRCSFGSRSIVPDLTVFLWHRIPFTPVGEVPNNFEQPPDWTIEIFSLEQKANKVIGNILYCLNHSC